MPHSSGGGSHSGGHHSGHSHSGSGSSRTKRRSSFKGATKYVYYVNKKPEILYADYDISREKPAGLANAITSYAILMIFCALLLVFSWHNPKKLDTNGLDTQILILDDENLIENREGLKKSLRAFFNETGIIPAVKTLNHDQWNQKYYFLEDYAYHLYKELFTDEKHWLIVYSTDPDLSDDFDNWQWEGMQGNDTDPILAEEEQNIFNSTLQKYLLQREKYDVGQALQIAFDSLRPLAMRNYLPESKKKTVAGIAIFFSLICIPLIISFVNDYRKWKYYATAVKCPDEFVDQEKCSYCDGIYIAGLHKRCPHCGALLKKQM